MFCTIICFQLKFNTDLTVALIEYDSGEIHLVVHGYPLDVINITITRLSDNSTEYVETVDEKFSLFNGSLMFRYQKDHSHFFVKYFDIFVSECTLCPPRLSHHIDGDYSINVCHGEECAVAVGTFLNANPSHAVSYILFYKKILNGFEMTNRLMKKM